MTEENYLSWASSMLYKTAMSSAFFDAFDLNTAKNPETKYSIRRIGLYLVQFKLQTLALFTYSSGPKEMQVHCRSTTKQPDRSSKASKLLQTAAAAAKTSLSSGRLRTVVL